MAYGKQSRVYLGYEDEHVSDKYRSEVSFTTNKIGGKPDWHSNKSWLSAPQCRLCGLEQILVVQIYAPLENSKYHRTLYIFACINPNCWNQNESWTCLRMQSEAEEKQSCTLEDDSVNTLSATSWLADADDWGDTLNDNSHEEEQNGNNMLLNVKQSHLCDKREDDLSSDFAELRVAADPNANSPASVESPVGVGAVGRLDSVVASAEIEGTEGEVVCIDTPTEPQCDLISLLHQVSPLPVKYADKREHSSLFFTEFFISVEQESLCEDVPQHIHDLFLKYQKDDKDWRLSSTQSISNTDEAKGIDSSLEKYEKSTPMHGDKTFHHFVSRIKKNPGQILRYARDNNAPLLLYSISGCVGRCRHCGDEMIFELQVLPSLIPKLQLNSQADKHFQIEFGTVLIYTCVSSCWSPTDTYREEHAIVQAERL